ncbi:antitoxin [Streptomyces sp. CA-288835]|uniref:antitoxin n=1 Tax=Streptomyces sp. CA-288835 TaxID=3240069 RepID=UPI003D8DD3F5
MPEEVHRVESGELRARTGPRHAAPKKPLLTRLQMPAGKAIAIASMPTAILMGMGITPTLARADDKPSPKNLTIDEYKECVDAIEESEEGKDASPSPSPSTSDPASDDKKEQEPEQGSSGEDASGDNSAGGNATGNGSSDNGSSSDSGSDDKPETEPEPAEPAPEKPAEPTPSPSPSESNHPLDPLGLGKALEDLFTPDDKEKAEEEAAASPSPTPSPSANEDKAKDEADKAGDSAGDAADKATDTVGDAAKDVTDTAGDAAEKAEGVAKDVTDKASEAAEDTAEKAEEAAGEATPSPSPSESAAPENCVAATEDEGGLEKGIPLLADDPWQLEASSLLLKGADYQGVVKVKTANGTVKEVLKYVISDGTDIGDLHQTVDDKRAGAKHHVQAGKGTTSTIREGKTVMYTESISGNLLGLIPVTFSPEHPPPLNIPLIYFTNVKVVQAAQFGGTLTVPGLQQFSTPLG